MSKNNKLTIVSAVIISSVLISGCSLLGDKENVDPPQSTTYEDDAVKENADQETTGEVAAEDTMPIELYLMDKYGYVVPQTLNLPKTNSIAQESLEYLVKDGKVTEMLPNDFQAVIPQDTKISINVDDDKVATVDFSNEFKEYEAKDEEKILQSITWTLTQFDSIDSVKLSLNGHALTEMPVNKTPIQGALTRADGINVNTDDVTDITNTKPLTVYYIGGDLESYYYVPVTKRVSNGEENNVTAAVGELIEGPGMSTSPSLTSLLPEDVKLLDDPVVEDGKVTLNFNENIYSSGLDGEEKVVADEILNSLVLSLTEQEGIESVAVTVNGEADLVNAEGESLTKPVTRPENVNTGSF